VGTLSDAPPNIFIDPSGKFTGYDNELLRAIAGKLGLEVEFVATDFSALLSQVQTKQFDVGSSSISTTEARRQNVGFTNGYDFGFMAVVAKTDGDVKGFDDLTADLRIGVVQGTVQDDYVTNTLKMEPIRFPDYATVYANVRNGQVDAWVAPSQQAEGQVKDGDGTQQLVVVAGEFARGIDEDIGRGIRECAHLELAFSVQAKLGLVDLVDRGDVGGGVLVQRLLVTAGEGVRGRSGGLGRS
jgi:ABC-type amino acid transport substrate-binding protein